MEIRQTFLITRLAPPRSFREIYPHGIHEDFHGFTVMQGVLQELRRCDRDHRVRVLPHSLLTSRRFNPRDHVDVLSSVFFAVVPTASPAGQ